MDTVTLDFLAAAQDTSSGVELQGLIGAVELNQPFAIHVDDGKLDETSSLKSDFFFSVAHPNRKESVTEI